MEGPGLAVRRTISRILLGCLLALALAGLQTRSAQAVAGDLDPAFGEAGSFSTIVLGAFELIGRAVAVQPDGKIVVAAQLHGGIDDVDIALFRLLPDGYPDGGFGGAVSDFSPLDIPADIAVQGDGKIVVVGTVVNGASAQGFVARFNANGTVDTGFGAGGKFIMPSGDPSSWNAVALQADGKIVVAGQVGDQFTVARFTAAGALDSGFGGDGLASAAIAGYSWAEDVAVNGEGKIVAVGGVDNDTSDYDVLVVSFNSDGSGNADFGLAGLFALDFSANSVDSARRLVIDGSGRIVVAGHFEDPFDYEHKAFLIRLASGGYLDPSFGDMGRVRLSADDGLFATGLQQDSLGRLVLAGYLDFEDDSWLARFSADGALDHGFGYDGLKVVSRGEDSCYFHGGLSLDSQDRPVCTGSTTGKLIVTRHQSDDHTYLWNNTWWWSDPERTDSYLVEADRVTIKAGATQDIWNCTRGQAPMFCRELPGGLSLDGGGHDPGARPEAGYPGGAGALERRGDRPGGACPIRGPDQPAGRVQAHDPGLHSGAVHQAMVEQRKLSRPGDRCENRALGKQLHFLLLPDHRCLVPDGHDHHHGRFQQGGVPGQDLARHQ